MERIINYIKEHTWIDVLLIVIVMIVFALLFGTHVFDLFTDRGREFLLPETILNGAVPYKDITLIYFPLAYYINALIYKVLGVSIYSLMTTQFFVCTFLIVGFYFLAREFLNRKISLILTLFILSSCIFSVVDLFSFFLPYSFAMLYGIAGTWICVFCLIKLFKTDNMKYAYVATFAGGFALACKLEFYIAPILITFALFFYKRLELKQYLKLFLTFMIFPVITLAVLFIHGMTLENLKDAIAFGKAFASTSSMKDFLTTVGMYPLNYGPAKIREMVINTMNLVQIIFFAIITLALYKKFKFVLILPVAIYLIYNYSYDYTNLFYYWVIFPLFLVIFICINFKEVKRLEPTVLLLILASFLLCQRTFFHLSLRLYGTYGLPFILLAFCVILDKLGPKISFGVKTENIISLVLATLICLYTGGLTFARTLKAYPVKSSKGTLYTTYISSDITNTVVNFVKFVADKDDAVLMLQEGSIINFLSDRKADMHSFMIDRLYYDALGDDKAMELIKQGNYKYLMLSDIDVSGFERTYLYERDANRFVMYIYENYKPLMLVRGDKEARVIIMKKMTPEEKKQLVSVEENFPPEAHF